MTPLQFTGRNHHADRADGGAPRWQVRIVLDGDAGDAASAAHHLARYGCEVVQFSPRGLLVELPNATGQHDAGREARLYLSMWQTDHSRAVAHVEPGPRAA